MAQQDQQDLANAAYRNASLPISERVNNLISLMTLPEKAGQLFHDMVIPGPVTGGLASGNAAFNLPSTEHSVGMLHMTHFNLLGPVNDTKHIAQWQNTLQRRAQQTRLGIPITLSTDPRNHFSDNPGAAFQAGTLAQWPETLGLAALRDAEVVRKFADCARQEYLALGLRVALHPQIDLATEPRWSRVFATFGEDADLSSELVAAYIKGFQGDKLGTASVATMTKHFPGGGPQLDGEDPHFTYGKEQVYPGGQQDYHLKPFVEAIEAGGSQMMPYYGMPIKTEWEEVGFGLNRDVITGLLREKLGFDGIVCTDWGLVTDTAILGQDMPARAWGAEHLSEAQRVKKILDAGCDQFGGESRPELVVELVEQGQIPETRIDEALKRLLKEKFVLGLFENPFVDEEEAVKIVGNHGFRRLGELAQRESYTILSNKNGILPLDPKTSADGESIKVYAENIDTSVLLSRGFIPVADPSAASLAILRLRAPFEPRPGGFEARFHAGSLTFPVEEITRQAAIYAAVPTIVDLYLDRAAVVPEIAEASAAFLVSYGSSAEALMDVVCGVVEPKGRLPFDLPRSMEAVRESRSDVAYDTKDPVFRFGDGLMGYAK